MAGKRTQAERLAMEKIEWGKRERELRKANRALYEALAEVVDTFSVFRSPSEETMAKARAALAAANPEKPDG